MLSIKSRTSVYSMIQNYQRSYISISAEIVSTKQQQKLETIQNKQTKHDKK